MNIGLFFLTMVRLLQNRLGTEERDDAIQLGMRVETEIRTGERRG